MPRFSPNRSRNSQYGDWKGTHAPPELSDPAMTKIRFMAGYRRWLGQLCSLLRSNETV